MIGEGGQQILSLNDFSGGIADFPLDVPNTYEIADNFLITEEKTLEVSPGSRMSFYADVKANGNPVNALMVTKAFSNQTARDVTLMVQQNSVFAFDSVSASETYFSDGLASSFSLHRSTLHETNTEVYINPRDSKTITRGRLSKVVYNADAAAYKLYQAGLPYVGNTTGFVTTAAKTTASIALVNTLKAKYNAHHSPFTYVTAIADATTIASAKSLLNDIMYQYTLHVSVSASLHNANEAYYRDDTANTFGGVLVHCPTPYKNIRPSVIASGTLNKITYSPSDEQFFIDLTEMVRIFNLHLFSLILAYGDATYLGLPAQFSHSTALMSSSWVTHSAAGVLAQYTTAYVDECEPLRAFISDLEVACNLLALHLVPTGHLGGSFAIHGNLYNFLTAPNTYYGYMNNTEASAQFSSKNGVCLESLMIKSYVLFALYELHTKSTTVHNAAAAAAENLYTTYTYDWKKAFGVLPDLLTSKSEFLSYLGNIFYKFASGHPRYGSVTPATTGFYYHVISSTRHTSVVPSTATVYRTFQLPTSSNTMRALFALTYYYKYTNQMGDVIVQEGEPIYRDYGMCFTNQETYPADFSPTIEWPSLDTSFKYPSTIMTVRLYIKSELSATYYKIAEIPYSNWVNMAPIPLSSDLVLNEPLYTSLGLAANSPPPFALAFCIFENAGFYGNCVDAYDGSYRPNRVYQSIQGDIDSVPVTFSLDMPSTVIGLGATKNGVIVLTAQGVYILDGMYNADGSGSLTYKLVDLKADCVDPNSVVYDGSLFYFFGAHNIYSTDGFSCVPIADHIADRYAAFDKDFVSATYSEKLKSIFFLMTKSDRTNPQILTLNIDLSSPGRGCFTLMKGYAVCSIAIGTSGDLIASDTKGFLHTFSSSYTDKDARDTQNNSISATRVPISYDFLSGKYSFNSKTLRKYITTCSFIVRDSSSPAPYRVSVTPYYINDNSTTKNYMAEIDYTSTNTELTIEKRHMNAGSLRCMYKQIGMLPATRIITSSGLKSTGYVNPAGLPYPTLTLDTGFTFASDVEGKYLYMSYDGYVKKYLVLGRNVGADTIFFQLTDGASPPVGNYDWTVEGIPTDERLEIVAIDIPFEMFSRSLGRNIPQGNSL